MSMRFDWEVVFPNENLGEALTTLKVMFPKMAGRFQLPDQSIVVIGDVDESAPPIDVGAWRDELPMRVMIDSYIRENWEGDEPLPPEDKGEHSDEQDDDEPDVFAEDDDDDDDDLDDDDSLDEAWESGMQRAAEEYDDDEEEDDDDDDEEDDDWDDEEDDWDDESESVYIPLVYLDMEMGLDVDQQWSRISIGTDFRRLVNILSGSPNIQDAVKTLARHVDGYLLANTDGEYSVNGHDVSFADLPESCPDGSVDGLATFLQQRCGLES